MTDIDSFGAAPTPRVLATICRHGPDDPECGSNRDRYLGVVERRDERGSRMRDPWASTDPVAQAAQADYDRETRLRAEARQRAERRNAEEARAQAELFERAREFERQREERQREEIATPKADDFELQEVVEVGAHLVVKARYPNCAKCAYEGSKVMVFTDTTAAAAVFWRKIDPHFTDPARLRARTEAPSPAARFPASPEGWQDALMYATQVRRAAVQSAAVLQPAQPAQPAPTAPASAAKRRKGGVAPAPAVIDKRVLDLDDVRGTGDDDGEP